jgi:uncharacterized membrane-anchored protein YitT (DUF2179 family)
MLLPMLDPGGGVYRITMRVNLYFLLLAGTFLIELPSVVLSFRILGITRKMTSFMLKGRHFVHKNAKILRQRRQIRQFKTSTQGTPFPRALEAHSDQTPLSEQVNT